MFSNRGAEGVHGAPANFFKYNLNGFPVGAKEVLCCALQTLATGLEPALLDCYGYCCMNKLEGSESMLPQENF